MIGRFLTPPEQDRWDDYFEAGEVLLWQGAPEPGARAKPGLILLSIFGIPFLFGGLTTAGAGLKHLLSVEGGFDLGLGIFLLAFSVPFLGIGFGLVFGTWIYAALAHRFIRYALSNKRAYIAKSLFKHTLYTYTIRSDDAISLEQGKTDTIRFKTYHSTDVEGDKRTTQIGFEGITNGAEVYALIRQVQSEAHHED